MHLVAFIFKIFTCQLRSYSHWQSSWSYSHIGAVAQTMRGWVEETSAPLRLVCSCVMKRKNKGRTEIAHLMCLILVVPVFLCQLCDEEIKEKQQSECRIQINKSSGTQSAVQGMISVLGQKIKCSLHCVSDAMLNIRYTGNIAKAVSFVSSAETHIPYWLISIQLVILAFGIKYKSRPEPGRGWCWSQSAHMDLSNQIYY